MPRAALMHVVRRALNFVQARPELSHFLRRQLGRFPGLSQLVRTRVIRFRHQGSARAALPAESDLPDQAQRILKDLRNIMRQH
jgi:hypothetical protein